MAKKVSEDTEPEVDPTVLVMPEENDIQRRQRLFEEQTTNQSFLGYNPLPVITEETEDEDSPV